jgi:hypothetical protein
MPFNPPINQLPDARLKTDFGENYIAKIAE